MINYDTKRRKKSKDENDSLNVNPPSDLSCFIVSFTTFHRLILLSFFDVVLVFSVFYPSLLACVVRAVRQASGGGERERLS